MGRPGKLTKEKLEEYGIGLITADGKIFRKDGTEVSQSIKSKKTRYDAYEVLKFTVYDKDIYAKDGRGIKTIISARAMYAWFYGEAPANMDVDHINNNSLDNRLENLQLLTRKENLAKRHGYMNQYESSYRG